MTETEMSMANDPIFEAFSLTHAAFMDGTKTFEEELAGYNILTDVYGVNDGSVDPQSDDYDNEGDDDVLSTWAWLKYADVNVQAGYMSFPLIARITGGTISSSGAGATKTYGMDLWHEDSINVAPFPAMLVCPSKDADGQVRRFVIGLYRVQPKPMTFDGPKYKDGLKVNLIGRALKSRTDEKGQVFADGKKRVGKVISII